MTRPSSARTARRLVVAAVIVLAILHQDFWLWDDATLVFGVIPIGLAYHTLFSIASATVWALTVRFAWPTEIEEWAVEQAPDEGAAAR